MPRPVRIGLMGFGQVGRQTYISALEDPRCEVVAVSDIGEPTILHHLLTRSTTPRLPAGAVTLEGNHLVARVGDGVRRARFLRAGRPAEVPWDVLDVELVIDATGRFRSHRDLAPHLANGVRRVIVSSLPAQASGADALDRVVLYGVNQGSVSAADRIVSAGSASTTAAGLALKVITEAAPIAHATLTSVHAYTSDQSLQDHVGADYRRSRSGAENIIPNDTPAVRWVERLLPAAAGKVSGFAMNVPVPAGSLLDLTVAFADAGVQAATVNDWFAAAAQATPTLLGVTRDPIVSSDVKNCPQSLLVDLQGTLRAGERMVKLLAWHETLGHARRILDVAACYARVDADSGRARRSAAGEA